MNTGEFNRCFNSNETSTVLASAIGEGVPSTPSIEVNGAPVGADLQAINGAIDTNLGAVTTPLESGLIEGAETDNTENETEATEAVEMTEEAMDASETDSEMTEEAMEMTEEAEATEASE